MFSQAQQEQSFLPVIRQNLKLLQGTPDESGSPRWLLFDPMVNKYYTLSQTAVKLMSAWHNGQETSSFLFDLKENGTEIDEAELNAFCEFLNVNGLVVHHNSEDVARLTQCEKATKHSLFKWLIHNYLFIRLSLFRPDDFLEQSYPYVKWLFKPQVKWIILILGGLGILLTLRQWDEFTNAFSYFWSWEGLAFYIITLIVVKVFHELGHAYVAKKYHCRVSSMGIAFMVLFPFLYTDTTDAWKLKSRYQKLDIVTAGVRVELYIALLATFLWSFLPDGMLKSAAFVLATTTWVSTLIINASPFLRFDGYYAFSDWLGVENLQSRSFALGRWALRKTLFGIDLPAPEPLPRKLQRTLIFYAWFTWIYRFFLFLGIALLVYYFAFKVLGIILFIIEIFWFILLPIQKEFIEWWKMRKEITLNRKSLVTASMLVGLIALLVIPWQRQVSLDAVYKSSNYIRLYSPEPATIASIHVESHQAIHVGEKLVQLTSPELDFLIKVTELNIAKIQSKLDRIASFSKDRYQVDILQEGLQQEQEALTGLKKRQQLLQILSPIDGVVSDLKPMTIGQTVGVNQHLIGVVAPTEIELIAFLPESQINAVSTGAKGTFIANHGEELQADLTVTSIEKMGIQQLEYEILSSVYGGNLGVRKSQEGEMVPESPYFLMKFKAKSLPDKLWMQQTAGKVVVEAYPKSGLSILWDKIMAVLIRESGF